MSNKLYIPIIIGALGMLSASDASAQRMAVKSNLLADALASPNIGGGISCISPVDTGYCGTLPAFCSP